MGNWLKTHPMVIVWLLMVVGIILLERWAWPVDLLRDTEVDYLDSTTIFQAVIKDYPSERKKTNRLTVELQQSVYPKQKRTKGTVYLYLEKDSSVTCPQYGDTILVKTCIRRGGMLGSFDYGRYLRLSGIVGSGFVRKGDWLVEAQKEGSAIGSPVEWQHALEERYRQLGIEGEELATLSALTLGQKELLDEEQKHAFQRSGAAHVLAVSGLHTGIIYAILLWLIQGGGRWRPLYEERGKRWLMSGIVIGILWLYAALTGFTPSVVRSVTMLSLVEIGRLCYRQAIGINIVAAAAVMILIVRPTDLFSVSFQMSFAAVVAIMTLMPHLTIYFHTPTLGLKWGKRIVNYIKDLLLVSLAAQLGTMPIALYYFGQCSNYFLLTNLIVLPLTWLIVMSAIGLLLLGGIPYVGWLIVKITNGLVWTLNHAVGWIENLPGAVSQKQINEWQVGLLYAIIIVGMIGYKLWKRRYEQLHTERIK